MIHNADITAYLKSVNAATRSEVYTRVQVRAVTWEERKAANVLRSGDVKADRISVYIPLDRAIDLQEGDVIVKGLVTDEISSSFTITALKAKYPASATVRRVDRHDIGSYNMRHLEIGAS